MPHSIPRKVELPCPMCGKPRLVQLNRIGLKQPCSSCKKKIRSDKGFMKVRRPKNNKGIIEIGDPNCIHYEYITTNSEGHLIGRCKCGRVVDYTIAQKPYMGSENPLAEHVTLERIFRG